MKVLHLTLHRCWFDMIQRGEKKEEYRAISPYWVQRLHGRHYDAVHFVNGYGQHRPRFTIELLGISQGIGNPAWGAPEKPVFILKLGSVLDENK